MKLYMHPISTVSRPVMFFAADEGIKLDTQVVDLMKGEHMGAAYAAVNPNCQVPTLEDGDFRLTECSAILKYLADVKGSAAYPKDLKQRARVNELMDWLNTGFYRTFGYGICYAQILPHHKNPDANGQKAALEMAKKNAEKFFSVLDKNILGKGNAYLAGDQITIADYLASGMVSLGEVIGCTYDAYPNVKRWYAKMKARPNWEAANGAVAQWASMAKGPAYVTV
ncbi:MAG: glutathione S-transferase family protein [Alphaproteobacteria bacterium]